MVFGPLGAVLWQGRVSIGEVGRFGGGVDGWWLWLSWRFPCGV